MTVKMVNLVWDSSVRGATKRFVLVALADRASDQGEITAYGVDELIGKTGLGRSTVFALLKQLEETDDLIKRVEQHNPDGSQRYSRFWLNVPLLRELRRADAERRSEDDATNPFTIAAAQGPVPILDPPPVTQGPDSGPPDRPDSGPSPRPDSGPPDRPDSGPLNPNPKTDSDGRTPLPEPTDEHRALAGGIIQAVDLTPVDPKPTQVRQIRDVTAVALAAGYTAEQVQAYLALKVGEGRVVKYVLGAFAPHRLPDIPAALLVSSGRLPICGQCDARPGDPISARVIWLDEDHRRSAPCPRCHPKSVVSVA